MNWRKGMALSAAVSMAAGMLAGCASGSGTTGESLAKNDGNMQAGAQTASGRYVEEELETPWEEDAKYIGSYQEENGSLHIFMMDLQTGQVMEYCYDGDWEIETCDWANELQGDESSIFDLCYGEDGNLYLLADEINEEELQEDATAEPEPIPWHLYCHSKSGTEEIFLPFLSVEGQKDQFFFPYYMGVTKNGDFVFRNGGEESIGIYGRKDGKRKAEIETHELLSSNDGMNLVRGNTVITLANNETELNLYDTEAEGQERRIEIGDQERGFLTEKDGSFYLANSDGIWTFREEGSIVEQIFDGTLGTMSSGSKELVDFQAGKEGMFFAMYRGTGSLQLCRYWYDSEASVLPEQTLNVYGLWESRKIKEAMRVFQKEHQDVKVEYQYAYGEFESGNTEDIIKTLNTELLGGQGADVLILDGLPADSYAEKGVLAELDGLSEKLKKEQAVLDAVLEGSKKDGKCYGIPTGMTVPVVFGTEELCGAIESLDGLNAFLKQEPEAVVTGVNAYSEIAWMLFGSNYEQVQQEDGSVDQESIAKILTLAKQIGDNNNEEWVQMLQEGWMQSREDGTWILGSPMGLESCESYYDTGCVGVRDINGITSIARVCDILRTLPMELKGFEGLYIPRNILAVNAASRQKELAEEFIETVLSNEVQLAAEENLPVRPESLDGLKEMSEGMQDITMADSSWDEIMHSYGYPSAEEMEPFVEILKQVQEPLDIDMTVQEAFLDAADRYFEEGLSEKDAAAEMAAKVDTYLAE